MGAAEPYVQGPAFHKNGLIRETTRENRYSAYVVMLPGGYTAVAASNSGLANIFTRPRFVMHLTPAYSPPTASPVQAQIRARLGGRCVYW